MTNEQDKEREQESTKETGIELEEYKRLAEERFDKLKYLQADFDNYRKKFDKEKESIIRLANENLIQELIVILDDFFNHYIIIMFT